MENQSYFCWNIISQENHGFPYRILVCTCWHQGKRKAPQHPQLWNCRVKNVWRKGTSTPRSGPTLAHMSLELKFKCSPPAYVCILWQVYVQHKIMEQAVCTSERETSLPGHLESYALFWVDCNDREEQPFLQGKRLINIPITTYNIYI
jgi:hypothetical protein